MTQRSTSSDRRRFIATTVGFAFLVCGVTLIGVAMASQRTMPEPLRADTDAGPVPAPAAAASTKRSEDTEPSILPRSKPVSLDIPAIDVHSVVRDLGLTTEGALETPAPGPFYDDAAWYRYSPTPGSLGPAILLGHVDSAANGPSVFFRLGELRRGDRVSVTRADDSIAVFVVDEVRQYPKNDFPTDTVYGDIDHAGLRIITCGGAFDDSAGHYLDNIVVFASLAEPSAN